MKFDSESGRWEREDTQEIRAVVDYREDILCLDDRTSENTDEWLQSDVWFHGGEMR